MIKISTKQSYLIICMAALLSGVSVLPVQAGGDRSAHRKEQSADQCFLRGKFDKAMRLYEKAAGEASTAGVQASLHAKAARLYYLQRQYGDAAAHFGAAMSLQEESLGVEDVCDYIDALRFQGQGKQAEAVCLRYAYQSVYSRNQRYQNTLDALSMYPQMDNSFVITPVKGASTSAAEYWVGRLDGILVYARSKSPFSDPSKRFYYDTGYAGLYASGFLPSRWASLPDELLNGPFAVGTDKNRIIGMGIAGRASKKIELQDGRLKPCVTKLFEGRRNDKGEWKVLGEVFPQKHGYSYCHPFFCDESRVLLFSSDVPGGYGGYDLYVIVWNGNTRRWSVPLNLGPEVNTPGDEIFPTYFEGRIYFSSNGHPGLGGYDLYSCVFDLNTASYELGTVSHLPSPLNSVFNDFCMLAEDSQWGYFVSDRNQVTGDDIYTYRIGGVSPLYSSPFLGMSEQEAVLGGSMLLSNMLEKTDSHKSRRESYPAFTPQGLVLTLYFDFDSAGITDASEQQLQAFLSETRDYDITCFRILGYADEMGSDQYNEDLSCKRGAVVAQYLRQQFSVPMHVKGCGRTPLSEDQLSTPRAVPKPAAALDSWGEYNIPTMSYVEQIRLNQPARRVDVYIN